MYCDDQIYERIVDPVEEHIQRLVPKHKFQKEIIQEKHDINPKRSTENAKSEYDIQCDLELVETIPLSLKKGGFAKKMVVEHKSILQVRIQFFLIT